MRIAYAWHAVRCVKLLRRHAALRSTTVFSLGMTPPFFYVCSSTYIHTFFYNLPHQCSSRWHLLSPNLFPKKVWCLSLHHVVNSINMGTHTGIIISCEVCIFSLFLVGIFFFYLLPSLLSFYNICIIFVIFFDYLFSSTGYHLLESRRYLLHPSSLHNCYFDKSTNLHPRQPLLWWISLNIC